MVISLRYNVFTTLTGNSTLFINYFSDLSTIRGIFRKDDYLITFMTTVLYNLDVRYFSNTGIGSTLRYILIDLHVACLAYTIIS